MKTRKCFHDILIWKVMRHSRPSRNVRTTLRFFSLKTIPPKPPTTKEKLP